MNASDPKAEQLAYWSGPVGERWAAWQPILDRALAPFAERLVSAAELKSGERVLDVGCGCGVTTLLASTAVGSTGSIVGVDLSAPMVERARSRSSGRGNIHYVLTDAAVEDFDKSFDAALSRFGIMFFDDPVAAFRNLHAALVPGGRIAFACWRSLAENEWARVPRELAARFVTATGPWKVDGPGPFSLADRARIESILEQAGFSKIVIEPFDADVVMSEDGAAGAVEFATNVGPASALLREASPETKIAVRAALLEAFTAFGKGAELALRGATWIVRASK